MLSTPLHSQATPMDYEKKRTLQKAIEFSETCRKHQKDPTQYSDSPPWCITLCCPRDPTGPWVKDAVSSCLSQARGTLLKRGQRQGTSNLHILSTREECEMRLHPFINEIT